MSIVGTYDLELTCDAKVEAGVGVPGDYSRKPGTCGRKQTFVEPTRMEALATARYEGWMITKSRTAICPSHAEERRASWR